MKRYHGTMIFKSADLGLQRSSIAPTMTETDPLTTGVLGLEKKGVSVLVTNINNSGWQLAVCIDKATTVAILAYLQPIADNTEEIWRRDIYRNGPGGHDFRKWII